MIELLVGLMKRIELNKTKSGKEIKINRRVNLKYQAAFDRSYNLPRCHYCVNHGNFLAERSQGLSSFDNGFPLPDSRQRHLQ